VYSEWQDKFEDYSLLHPSVKFTQRYTDVEYYYDSGEYTLVILDDLYNRLNSDAPLKNFICKLYTQKAHHKQIIPILITHTLFSSALRTISLNTQVFVLFKQRDKTTYTVTSSFVVDALEDATRSNPHGFIAIDLNVRSGNEFRCKNFSSPTMI
jgi:hypothetical protein